MVTHALHLTLPLADYTVALSNGFVAFEGDPHNYVIASGQNTPGLASGQDFSSLILKKPFGNVETFQQPISTEEAAIAAADHHLEDMYPHVNEDPLRGETLLTNAEKQSTGAVSFGVYTYYAKAAGSPLILAALVAVIMITEGVSVGSNWALRLWASSFDRVAEVSAVFQTVLSPAVTSLNATETVGHDPDFYLRYYVILASIALVLFGARVCE
jgi:hypothetical protein